MSHEVYLAKKAEAGKRKLRGTALLAYGDDESRFEAAVLFHEAARLEQQALELLDSPSAEERLGSAVERCGCLIDGLAFTEVLSVWGEVEALTATVPVDVAAALRRRLDPAYDAMRRASAEALRAAPALRSVGLRWRDVPLDVKAQARAECRALLQRFPGELGFHLVEMLALFEEGSLEEAARAALRAHRLQPDEPRTRGMMLMMAGDALSPEQVAALLDRTYEELRRQPADAFVHLGFALASLGVSSEEPSPEQIQRALWAVEAAPSAGSKEMRDALRAIGMILRIFVEAPDVLNDLVAAVLESVGLGGRGSPATSSRGAVLRVLRSRAVSLVDTSAEPPLAA